jgi:hypothetical protein
MMRRLPLAVVVLALAFPAHAGASAAALIQDCITNGRITGHYSQQDYAQALAHLPSDIQEYSDCAQVIRAAELAAAAGLPTPGSGSGVSPRVNPLATATPAEKAAVAAAQSAGGQPLDVGGVVIKPGVVEPAAFNTLPAPMLAVLAILLSIALALSAVRLRNFVRARRSG